MEATLRKHIAEITAKLGVAPIVFAVEHPSDLAHGDYATNVALVCAKQLGKSPREIAEQFRAELEGTVPQVERIEIAGPGFINFFLTRDFFREKIAEINAREDEWGKNTVLCDEEVLFEYTSPNLFKPLHIGNLVGNIVGESLTRIFEWSGAQVHRINYPSDIGLTVAKGVWGLQKTGGDPTDINALGEAYRVGNEAYETDGDAKMEIEAVNRALYEGTNPDVEMLRTKGIETSKQRLRELCVMLGTSFDYEIYESETGGVGKQIVESHLDDGVFERSEGAIIYRGERHGLHTRVFLNAQGLPTYEAKDLGNFFLKQERYPHWTQYTVVTGSEQREYFKVLIAALQEVFPESKTKRLENIATGFLTLTTGKMSSRKGNVLTGESLIAAVMEEAATRESESRAEAFEELTEAVAVAALKYQILRQHVGGDIVFDKERALSFEGDSGPYLQYTHARIASMLEKASGEGLRADISHAPRAAYPLEHILYQFPESVERALADRSPHHVVVYLTALAGAFNTFYGKEKIVDTSDEYAPYKLALARAVQITLKNGLFLLGIKAPARM